MRAVTCSYCGNPASLVTGRTLYPHRADLAERQFWRCDPCDAHVGCHRDSTTPFGNLANAPLRSARHRGHDLFDPLWREGEMTRVEAYSWLAHVLSIPVDQAHFGLLDAEQCWKAVDAIEAYVRALPDSSKLKGGRPEPVQPTLVDKAGMSQKERQVANAPDWLARAAIRFEVMNEGQHIVVFAGSETIDFWPSTQLWVVRGTETRREGLHPLIKYIRSH